jgi:hypothetical protein
LNELEPEAHGPEISKRLGSTAERLFLCAIKQSRAFLVELFDSFDWVLQWFSPIAGKHTVPHREEAANRRGERLSDQLSRKFSKYTQSRFF